MGVCDLADCIVHCYLEMCQSTPQSKWKILKIVMQFFTMSLGRNGVGG